MATPDIGKLDISDSDSEDLFASPSRTSKPKHKQVHSPEVTNAPPARSQESKYDTEQAKDDALRKELESVRKVNEIVGGVISSLEAAHGNMDTVSRTVTSSSTLLNTWIRILSQTEHNQRLILNPNWKGASQDVTDMENETVLKAQAAERRAAEEERRREESRRKLEDEERERQAGTAVRGVRGIRGRGRGHARSVSSSGYGVGGSSALGRGAPQTPGRGGSGVARGVRGRPRGLR